MITIPANGRGKTLIGRLGENEHRLIVFRESAPALAMYPNASVTVLHQRPGDPTAYPVSSQYVQIVDGMVCWTVQSGDLTKEGDGQCEVILTQNGTVAKLLIYTTEIQKALDGAGTPPDPWESWVQQVTEAAGQAEAAVEHYPQIIDGYWYVWDVEQGEFINTGVPAGSDVSGKADKADTVLDTTLSRGRKAGTTVGTGSFAFGDDVEASGANSHAEGVQTVSSGIGAHAEGGYIPGLRPRGSSGVSGNPTTAAGRYSHAEGWGAHADGVASHAEGTGTYAEGDASHAQGLYTIVDQDAAFVTGKYNKLYYAFDAWETGHSYAVNDCVVYNNVGYKCIQAHTSSSSNRPGLAASTAYWSDDVQSATNLAMMVGNGTSSNRSNAYELEWDGTGKYAGDVYANGDKKLATVEQVETAEGSAGANALKSEGYAVGTQNGTPVESGSSYFENNAKYFKQLAALFAQAAETAAGHYPYVGSNGKWWVWDVQSGAFVDTNVEAQGPQGDPGTVPDFSIGTVTTGAAGSDAAASISGTTANPVLNLTIPQGIQGVPGQDGQDADVSDLAPVIVNTADAADVCTVVDGADNRAMQSVVVGIEPVQDLHGYDNPWPAGGGANIWDEQWEQGRLVNGNPLAHNQGFRSKNYIKVTPGESYYCFCTAEGNVWISCYTDDYTYIANDNASGTFVASKNAVFAVPSNAYYIKFFISVATAYNKDFAINYPSSVTTWSPYANICPITGWTGCNVSRIGINVWDEQWEVGAFDTTTGENMATSGQIRAKNRIPVKPSTSYHATKLMWMIFYDNNGNVISNNLPSGQSSGKSRYVTSFITPPDCYAVRFYMVISYGTVYQNDISINYPATDTSYHAYSYTNIPIDWQSEAGTVYGGTLDVVSGVLTVDMAKKTLTSSDSFEIASGTTTNRITAQFYETIGKTNASFVSNTLETIANSSGGYGTVPWRIWGSNIAPRLWISVPADIDTVAKFKTYLETNPIDVVYYLATPVTYQLTPQEVTTLLGTNNVWVDCGKVSLRYPADTKLYIDNKITQAIANALNA